MLASLYVNPSQKSLTKYWEIVNNLIIENKAVSKQSNGKLSHINNVNESGLLFGGTARFQWRFGVVAVYPPPFQIPYGGIDPWLARVRSVFFRLMMRNPRFTSPAMFFKVCSPPSKKKKYLAYNLYYNGNWLGTRWISVWISHTIFITWLLSIRVVQADYYYMIIV